MKKENNPLNKYIEGVYYDEYSALEQAQAKLALAVEALEFYASTKHDVYVQEIGVDEDYIDGGSVAREALAKIKGKE